MTDPRATTAPVWPAELPSQRPLVGYTRWMSGDLEALPLRELRRVLSLLHALDTKENRGNPDDLA